MIYLSFGINRFFLKFMTFNIRAEVSKFNA